MQQHLSPTKSVPFARFDWIEVFFFSAIADRDGELTIPVDHPS
jgi:hypothetical protein